MPHVTVWRPGDLEGLELHRGVEARGAMPLHFHETYQLGLYEAGLRVFQHRGARHAAGRGSVAVIQSGEPHSGASLEPEGATFRVFLIDRVLLSSVASAASRARRGEAPAFRATVLDDAPLFDRLRLLHETLGDDAASHLERETPLVETLAALVLRHGDGSRGRAVRHAPAAIRRARDYLREAPAREVSLASLAAVAGLSRYHLVREFRRVLGLPPSAFQRQLRVERAQALLRAGVPPAQAAAEAGFVDQSHLNRWFKRLVGVTPGAYAAAMARPRRG